jgi:16S rRNA (cytidine1402-2'-O)-methyltransferase
MYAILFYLFSTAMLYFIPTPIGNKEDITLRALRLLKQLNLFLCEDTRTAKKLLAMYDIDYKEKQFFVLTSFTNQGKMKNYKKLIAENDVAMISEAGTPGLSDPGKSLIQLCNEAALPYSILP